MGGIVYGNAVGNRVSHENFDLSNNYYYKCTLEVYSSEGQLYRYSKEVTDPSILTNKDLAYNLNTTNRTEPHNGSWAQGATNPIITDEKNAAVAYVTYLRYNGDEGYKGMEYLIFPINPDGTP